MTSRRAVLVLGMHRSGTSALTRIVSLLGAGLPRDLMPPTDDNPEGYWESRRIARFNNRLLESAGTRWNDDAAIPDAWHGDPARAADRAEARSLIDEEFGAAPLVVLKDPRLCRLLPFWKTVLDEARVQCHAVLMLRDPLEVARSLAARMAVDPFRPAAVPAISRGLLLWLRYVLDAERLSRDLPRFAIDYVSLLDDWRRALGPLARACDLPIPADGDPTATAIAEFLRPGLRRQSGAVPTPEGGDPDAVVGLASLRAVHAALCGSVEPGSDGRIALDALAATLDHLQSVYAPVRRPLDPLVPRDVWAEAILARLAAVQAAGPPCPAFGGRKPTILFLSGAPKSIGHVYRVEHAVEALTEGGWRASWMPVDAPDVLEAVAQADVVSVFRARWDDRYALLRGRCTALRIPLVYDIDDLVFEPDLMAAGHFAYLDDKPESERLRWSMDADAYRQAVEQSDAAVLTTAPLAAAAARLCPRVHVLPNALSAGMLRAATAACGLPKPSDTDGRPRLGFASGTPTHQRDFATLVSGLVDVLRRRPEPLLTVVGHLDRSAYPQLDAFADRIECRPAVPFSELFTEVARFDVNLAPLEVGNRFCEAKSEVRVTVAAAIGVPSVAAATEPLRHAIVHGETGLLVDHGTPYEAALDRLLDDPGARRRMGEAARLHAEAMFGWATWGSLATRTYAGIRASRVGA